MPITVFTGPNTYSSEIELENIVDIFSSKHGKENVVSFDASEISFQKLSQALNEQGLFATKTLVILRYLKNNKEIQEKLNETIEHISPDAHLVIVEPQMDKRSALYKNLKKTSEVIESRELDEHSAAQWVISEFTTMGGSIAMPAAKVLVDRAGVSQWQLKSELDKLINYEKEIDTNAITTLVSASSQETIFNLLDLAFSKKLKQTQAAYSDMIANKVDPHYILSMIAWQLHNLLVVYHADANLSPDQIKKKAGVSPFVAKKCQAMLRKISKQELYNFCNTYVHTDLKSKTNASQSAEALVENLLTSIAS